MLLLTILLAGSSATTDASIVFFRPKAVMGFARSCPIRLNGREITELGRGRFARVTAKPGRYIFANKVSGIQIDAEAGKTYYVRCTIGYNGADLKIADNYSFDKVRAKEVDSPPAPVEPSS